MLSEYKLSLYSISKRENNMNFYEREEVKHNMYILQASMRTRWLQVRNGIYY